MNPQHPENQDMNSELERLQKAWSEPDPAEPSPLLDMAVLNRARREVEKRPARRWIWHGGWATAAVAVLAFGLLMQSPTHVPEDLGRSLPDSDESAYSAPLKKSEAADHPAPMLQSAPAAELSADAMTIKERSDSAPVRARAAQSESRLEADPDVLSAEQWMEKLSRLFEQGDSEELQVQLQQFRTHYPDYVLPAEWMVTNPDEAEP